MLPPVLRVLLHLMPVSIQAISVFVLSDLPFFTIVLLDRAFWTRPAAHIVILDLSHMFCE